jgi:hypothetical protein
MIGNSFANCFVTKSTNYWAGEVAQAVEHLPSTHEALNSNPSATKKKKKISWTLVIIFLNILPNFTICL